MIYNLGEMIKTNQEEVCHESKGSSEDSTNDLAGVGDAPGKNLVTNGTL